MSTKFHAFQPRLPHFSRLAQSITFTILTTTALGTAPVVFAESALPSASSGTSELSAPAPAVTDHSIELVWQTPEDQANIQDYQVFQDGRLLGTATENAQQFSPAAAAIQGFHHKDKIHFHQPTLFHSFLVNHLQPASTYHFTIKSVAINGQTSPASTSLTVTTAAAPSQQINITEYGAKGDGNTMNTAAIQKAIDACRPGCRIEIPAGTFKTGALWLKSDMTMYLDRNAILLGSDRPQDYPPAYHLYSYAKNQRPASLINVLPGHGAKHYQHVTIEGEGTVDGNGWLTAQEAAPEDDNDQRGPYYRKSSADQYSEDGILAKTQVQSAIDQGVDTKTAYGEKRSSLITMTDADGIYIHGITLRNPAFHGLMILHDQNAVVSDVTIQTYDANNGDGIEFGNSQHVMAFGNYINTGDDCINFAAGTGAKAATQPPMQDAKIFNNYFLHGHGAIVLGSHTGAWIEQVTADNNVMDHTDIGLRAKSTTYIGGGARDIVFRNNAMRNLQKNGIIVTLDYNDPNANLDYQPAAAPASFYHFTVENDSIDTIKKGPWLSISGNTDKDAWHHDLQFANLNIKNGYPAEIDALKNSSFEHIHLTDIKGSPVWQWHTVAQVTLDGKTVD